VTGPAPRSGRQRERRLLQVRPRRITVYGAIAATAVLATMVVVGLLLRGASDGVQFRVADQVGLIGIGLVGAGAIMLVARPRLRADDTGMWVRNVLGETYFPWAVVLRIAFPEGSHWAQLVLADDETHPLMAIQAMDRERAVAALRRVRELHAAHAPAVPSPSPEAQERIRRRAQAQAAAQAARPLGRLELIDREKAAQPPRRRRNR
jgi:hypothetical protein